MTEPPELVAAKETSQSIIEKLYRNNSARAFVTETPTVWPRGLS
jgi:hypothetical protein